VILACWGLCVFWGGYLLGYERAKTRYSRIAKDAKAEVRQIRQWWSR
jgi:hypothetical protein